MTPSSAAWQSHDAALVISRHARSRLMKIIRPMTPLRQRMLEDMHMRNDSRKAKKLALAYSRGVTSQSYSCLRLVFRLAVIRYSTTVAFLQGQIPHKIDPFFSL